MSYNPSFHGGSIPDNSFSIKNTTDITKKLIFDASNISTGQTRTIIMPDANVNLGLIVAATNLNTASTIVKRDASGNFTADTITANLIGNISGSASSFTGALSGDITGTQSATIIANTTVTGKLITDFVSGAGTVLATDSILQAINKLNGNIAASAPVSEPLSIHRSGDNSPTANINWGGFSITNLRRISSPDSNSWWGTSSGQSVTSGLNNSALGFEALKSVTSGVSNTASGWRALTANVQGNQNSAFGQTALQNNVNGDANSAFGYSALINNTSGTSNTGLGFTALFANLTGTQNTGVGAQALLGSTGSSNTALGTNAGSSITSGSGNLVLGVNAQVSSPSASNELAIGTFLTGNATNVEVPVARDFYVRKALFWGNSSTNFFKSLANNGAVQINNENAGQDTQIQLFNKNGTSANSSGFTAFGNGTPSFSGANEGIFYGWNATVNSFSINSFAFGTGAVVKPLAIYTGANTNQIRLDTDGTVSMLSLLKVPTVQFAQVVTPANPPALSNKLYFKAGNNLFMLNSAGIETQINVSGGGVNVFLSNLSGPTAINKSLLFGTDNVSDIGANAASRARDLWLGRDANINGNVNFNSRLNGHRVAVVDTNYTVLITDFIVAFTSLTASRTTTLPAPTAALSGWVFIIKDESGTAATNSIVLVGTVDGGSVSITANYGVARVYCNGTAYFTF